MTNKEKYPNAKVSSCDFSYGTKYYIHLQGVGIHALYLVDGKPSQDCIKGWYSSQQSAQAALDKFMTPDPTLSEIKSQLAEAKKLIGKKFTNTHDQEKQTCADVFLALEPSQKTSGLVNKQIAEKGFCIAVKTDHFCASIYPFSICKEDKSIQLSSQYTAELVGNYWKIGGVEVGKDFVQHMYDFLSCRVAAKIVFKDITFDLDMVKKLLES